MTEVTQPSRETGIFLGLAICSVHLLRPWGASSRSLFFFSSFVVAHFLTHFFENLDLNHFRQAVLYLCFYVLLWQLDRLILSYKLHFPSLVFLFSRLYLCVLLSCLAKFQSTVLFFCLLASACSPGCCENSLPGQPRRARRT